MPIKAVIFDLDGTITQPFFDFDAIREEIGLQRNAGPILEEIEKMTPEQRDYAMRVLHSHEQRAVEQSVPNPGAKKTLDAIHSLGIPIGVLTRNKRSNVLAVARKHGLEFDAIIDREDGPVKPDPFGILRICQRFGVRPQDALVVGDYLFDLLSAKAAGAAAVLLRNHKALKEFEKHADFIIDRLEQVLDIIEEKKMGEEVG